MPVSAISPVISQIMGLSQYEELSDGKKYSGLMIENTYFFLLQTCYKIIMTIIDKLILEIVTKMVV